MAAFSAKTGQGKQNNIVPAYPTVPRQTGQHGP